VHKSKAPSKSRLYDTSGNFKLLQINDLRGLHHYLYPVAATGARSTQHAIHRPRATVQLAGPVLGSFPARTRFVVLALIPVAGFLANAGEGNVGRAFATVTQSHALVDSSRDFKSAVAVEAEGLEAQVRQFLTNVQAA
jgi:hypothetical protein